MNQKVPHNTAASGDGSELDSLAAQDRLPGRVRGVALKILRPLARLFIAHGLTFGDAEKALKQAFFDAGRQELERSGITPNMSRISVSTGLHRKDIRRFVHEADRGLADLPMRSTASELYTRWVTDEALAVEGQPMDLPLRGEQGEVSFEWLARQISTDAHARSLLEDLKRLGLVNMTAEGKVRVDTGGFIPMLARTEMLELLGDNLADHLDTAVGNTVEEGEKRLEQAVFASGLSSDAIDQIAAAARPVWAGVMRKLVTVMKQADKKNPASDENPFYRVRAGMFFYSDQPRKSGSSTGEATDALAVRARKQK